MDQNYKITKNIPSKSPSPDLLSTSSKSEDNSIVPSLAGGIGQSVPKDTVSSNKSDQSLEKLDQSDVSPVALIKMKSMVNAQAKVSEILRLNFNP